MQGGRNEGCKEFAREFPFNYPHALIISRARVAQRTAPHVRVRGRQAMWVRHAFLLWHAVGVHLHNCRVLDRPPNMETNVPNLACILQTSRSRGHGDIFGCKGQAVPFPRNCAFKNS